MKRQTFPTDLTDAEWQFIGDDFTVCKKYGGRRRNTDLLSAEMHRKNCQETESPAMYPEEVEPPPMPAFTVLKRRWVVERTFGWLGRWRRLSKDYERLPAMRAKR